MKLWACFVALGLCQFALVSSVFMVTGALAPLAAHFSVPIGEAALAISVFSMAYALTAPFLTMFTARIQSKRVILGALIVFVVANVSATLASDFGMLLGLRIVAACADGLFAATANALAASLAPPGRKGRVLAIVNSGVTLALLAGVPVTTWLALAFGWQSTFYFVAAAAAVGALALVGLLPAGGGETSASFQDRVLVILTPGLLPTLAVTTISYTGLFVLYNFTQPLIERAGLDGVSIAHVLMTFGIGAIVGNALGGVSNDKLGAAKTVIVSLLALAGIMAGAVFLFASEPGVYAFYLLAGCTHYLALSPIQYRVVALAGSNIGGAMALNSAAAYAGVAMGAQLGGWLLDNIAGIAAIGLLGAGLKLIALGAFGWSYLSPPRPASTKA